MSACLSDEQKKTIDEIISHNRRVPSRLVQILREVQDRFEWLSPMVLTEVAEKIKLPRAHVEGVAGFYSFFYLKPVGQYRVLFSNNITDRMLGAPKLMSLMCRTLGVEPGHLSGDGSVSVDTTSCTGMCDQGPAILVNGRAITQLTPERVRQICTLITTQRPLSEWPAEFFEVQDNIRRADKLLNSKLEPGAALRIAMAMGAEQLLKEIEASNLRGRGGAGFTTATKWGAAKSSPAGEGRVVVCNADEGEPGTFKDRLLLSRYADHVIEGMTLCAYAIGANQGFIYLRGEYRYMLESLEGVLSQRRKQGFLGHDILGHKAFDFDIEIHVGAGAYVCGEETALIESLEGKRGTPRVRPPFPVAKGYMGRPTVVNNVETLAKAVEIMLHGAADFRDTGTSQSSGTKLLSVSGDCARPGIYEYPFGVSISRVLKDCGAVNVQAVQVGGASGICLAPHEFPRGISFENIPTAGSFMVFDMSRDMFEVARNFAHFFAHESCGFCTPCRVGTSLVCKLMDKIEQRRGANYDLLEIMRLVDLLKTSSHCGLGSGSANPIESSMTKFMHYYTSRLQAGDFEPSFDLDQALRTARHLSGRNDANAHLYRDQEN